MKVYLDNTLLEDEPSGEIITTIKRDAELGGYLITNDAKLSFWGDGYDHINTKIQSGFCGEINVKIDDECNGQDIEIFTGKLFILEIEKTSNCIINTPLQDNNYYARISKNKNIKTFIDSTRSKNNVTIAGCATNAMTMFIPATGATAFGTRTGYRVYDVFKNLMAFVSDAEVAFDSTLLGIGGEFEGLSITTGQELFFAGTGKAPQVSFSDFYSEVNKKLHTVIFIDARGTIPKVKIESDAVTYTNNIIKKLEAVGEVKFRVDASKLIAKVVVGSSSIDSAINLSFVEDNKYFTFKTEEYTTLGQCNIDASVDLVSKYILSSNIIEDCLINGNPNHSEDIFFVDCENVVASGTNYTSNAILGDPFLNAPPYVYNRRLMNDQVLLRWNNIFPNSIASFQGTINNYFKAAYTSLLTVSAGAFFNPFQFNDDYNFPNFDGDGVVNNYGNGTAQGTPVSAANSRYTCPEDGNYTFFSQFRVAVLNLFGGTPQGTFGFLFQRYNSGGTLLDQDNIGYPVSNVYPIFQNISYTTKVFPCQQGDYFQIIVTFGSSNSSILFITGTTNETYFACVSSPNSTGIISGTNNQITIPLIKADFEYDIKNTDFYDILNNLFDKIAFSYNVKDNEQLKAGWIDIIKYNHNTSEANITLRGSQNLIQ